jgi:hypothetical protein
MENFYHWNLWGHNGWEGGGFMNQVTVWLILTGYSTKGLFLLFDESGATNSVGVYAEPVGVLVKGRLLKVSRLIRPLAGVLNRQPG